MSPSASRVIAVSGQQAKRNIWHLFGRGRLHMQVVTASCLLLSIQQPAGLQLLLDRLPSIALSTCILPGILHTGRPILKHLSGMSDHWSPPPGLENDPSRDLEASDFTQHESRPDLPAQTPNINRHGYHAQVPEPGTYHVMPVELQQYLEDARANQLQNDSTQPPLHLSDASTVQFESRGRASPSQQPKHSNATRRTPAPGKDSPQRYSPYPSSKPKSQSKPTARSTTPTPSNGPILLSPNCQRGSPRSPSARPAPMSPHAPSKPVQPLSGTGQVAPTQQPVGPRLQHQRSTKSSDLALQAHLQSLSDRTYRDYLACYTKQYGLRLQDIHPDVLANLKNRAFASAHQMVHQATTQRNVDTPQHTPQLQQHHQMLPPPVLQPSPIPDHAATFDGQHSPELGLPGSADSRSDQGRSQSPATSSHTTLSAAPAHDEGLPSVAASGPGPEDSAPPPIESDASTPISHSNRIALLKSQVIMSMVTANNAYANRTSGFARFQRHYPHLQQNVMNSTYVLMAGVASLDLITPQIWTAPNEHLLQLVRLVSIRLKQVLPRLQGSIGNLLGNIQDLELRWTATMRSLEIFYNSFSSLKACLKTRDERRGDGQRTFVDALGLDRVEVWFALAPLSDDELDASLAEEQSVFQAQTVENQVAARLEWEALQAQQVQVAYQALQKEGA